MDPNYALSAWLCWVEGVGKRNTVSGTECALGVCGSWGVCVSVCVLKGMSADAYVPQCNVGCQSSSSLFEMWSFTV